MHFMQKTYCRTVYSTEITTKEIANKILIPLELLIKTNQKQNKTKTKNLVQGTYSIYEATNITIMR